MPTHAMRRGVCFVPTPEQAGSERSPCVLSAGDGIKVSRIDAALVEAEVIEIKPRRDGSDLGGVDHSVDLESLLSTSGIPPILDDAMTAALAMSLPLPTAERVNLDLRPDARD